MHILILAAEQKVPWAGGTKWEHGQTVHPQQEFHSRVCFFRQKYRNPKEEVNWKHNAQILFILSVLILSVPLFTPLFLQTAERSRLLFIGPVMDMAQLTSQDCSQCSDIAGKAEDLFFIGD